MLFSLVFAICAVVGFANGQGCPGMLYTVRPNDNLYNLVGNCWPYVAQVNGLSNPNLIYPGQQLCLPAACPYIYPGFGGYITSSGGISSTPVAIGGATNVVYNNAVYNNVQPGYAVAPAPGYAVVPAPGYDVAPAPGYAVAPPSGYAVAPPPGYAVAPPSGYAVAPPPGYAVAPPSGYAVAVPAPAPVYVPAPAPAQVPIYAPAPYVPPSYVAPAPAVVAPAPTSGVTYNNQVYNNLYYPPAPAQGAPVTLNNQPGYCTSYYTVQAGNTCASIAALYPNFQTLNAGINCNNGQALTAGQLVCTAGSAAYNGMTYNGYCSAYYTVPAGQTMTCAQIAQTYPQLYSYNTFQNMNCNALAAGTQVCVQSNGVVNNGVYNNGMTYQGYCSSWYTVQSGDTCASLAAKNLFYGSNNVCPSNLAAGQVYCASLSNQPAGYNSNAGGYNCGLGTITVQQGDTCATIANKANALMNSNAFNTAYIQACNNFLANNNNNICNNLTPGTVIVY